MRITQFIIRIVIVWFIVLTALILVWNSFSTQRLHAERQAELLADPANTIVKYTCEPEKDAVILLYDKKKSQVKSVDRVGSVSDSGKIDKGADTINALDGLENSKTMNWALYVDGKYIERQGEYPCKGTELVEWKYELIK